VALGGDPALMLSAAASLPESIDEVAFSGLLRGKPCPLIRAKTLSMKVPANAEFILEGVVQPAERRMEGPFGDHYGYYSRPAPFPVFHIKRVTRRRNAVYPATVVGKPPQEDKYIGDAVQEMVGPLMRLLRPELVSLWAYHEAGFHNLLVASVRVRYRREAIKTGLALLSESQLALTKCVILVDANVNSRDFDAVLKAIRRNFDPARDLTIIPRAPIDTLDFSSFRMHLGSKMIIDATSPVEEDLLPEESEGDEGQPSNSRPIVESLDPRIRRWQLIGGVMLVVKVSSGGREICEKLLRSGPPSGVKMVVAVSEDLDLQDREQLLWGIFTRFDPARDVVFAHSEMRGAMPIYHGPMGIDATFKEGLPRPARDARGCRLKGFPPLGRVLSIAVSDQLSAVSFRRREMRDFRGLKVWEKSHHLTLSMYRVTNVFPKGEMYGLTSQIRRASASIPANIAEGCGKSGDAELARFLQIAMGSASELEYHLLLARDLGFLKDDSYLALSTEVTDVKRMLASFIHKLKAEG